MADSLQLDVLDVQDVGEVIDKVRSFVQSEEVPGADAGSVAASITISEDLEDFRIEMDLRFVMGSTPRTERFCSLGSRSLRSCKCSGR